MLGGKGKSRAIPGDGTLVPVSHLPPCGYILGHISVNTEMNIALGLQLSTTRMS